MSPRELLAQRARIVAAGTGEDVPSPCISVCRMDARGELCLGCLRTLDEVAAWGRMGDGEKREVWALLAKRIEEEAA
ncbi:DUF1289 domain-containing protein [Ramlibacter sp. PS4R-6]|uniref:DUF1289 domain-containing protein n=1 Tax=Ramlibacter sp. PS4R-6 TaxID=3133438 RepID=UPI0030987347